MRDLSGQDFRRILIIKPSSLGDVIHALPVLAGLRQRYPQAHIAWLISTACAGLLEGQPDLDELIPFDRKRYAWVGRRLGITREFIGFLRELRTRRFDLVLDLQGLFRSGFIAWTCGARYRLGFAAARELGWIFYSDRLRQKDPERHAVERNYDFGRFLGFAAAPMRFPLMVSQEARAAVRARLAARGVAADNRYLLLAPGTRWETKRWPADRFAEVARRVRSELGWPVVIAGAPDECAVAAEVAALAGEGVVNFAGQTTLPEMTALVADAAGTVMNDSGPMHLAAALGRPLVAVYGPTSPLRTGPYGCPDSVVRLPLDCSPCYLKRLADCPYGHRCMRELSAEQVCQRLFDLLKGQGKGS